MEMPAMGLAVFQQWTQKCVAASSSTGRGHFTALLGEQWAWGMNLTTFGDCLLPPNPKIPNCISTQPTGGQDMPGMFSLSSFHPGGANVLMTDGSCRFLKDSTSQTTVWALGTRAQGEVLSADSY
jgi:prepilin-type processing-associated H-X9-DG protein